MNCFSQELVISDQDPEADKSMATPVEVNINLFDWRKNAYQTTVCIHGVFMQNHNITVCMFFTLKYTVQCMWSKAFAKH